MISDQRWLSTMWPIVRAFLPAPPATVIEIGCGPHGGFVPALAQDGYRATGIDPSAPDGPSYLQVEYEQSDVPSPVDAAIACTSLHHVADPAVVVDKIVRDLRADGICVVVEYDWENFDEATAQWCFARLGPQDSDGWLGRHRERWHASGQRWDEYFQEWAREHGLQGGQAIVEALDRRFERVHHAHGAYFFPELAETTEAEELQSIDAGEIHPARIDYVGRPRPAA